MIIEWKRWRVRSNEYCYVVERKINPVRWLVWGYYPTLAQACSGMLDQRIRSETDKYVIKAYDEASARIDTARLIKKIDLISREIAEAVDGRN